MVATAATSYQGVEAIAARCVMISGCFRCFKCSFSMGPKVEGELGEHARTLRLVIHILTRICKHVCTMLCIRYAVKQLRREPA